MNFKEILALVGNEPVFETGLLLAGDREPNEIRRQISRWTHAGRLHQLRRGLYSLAPPYQKIRPHPFLVANHLRLGSYVSLQSALAFHGLIPEHVPRTTSVGPGRPQIWETPLGIFEQRHLHRDLLGHAHWIEVDKGQHAFVATPEKALLDLVHLEPRADAGEYLSELRIQNLERLDFAALREIAENSGRPKLGRAAENLAVLAVQESEYETL